MTFRGLYFPDNLVEENFEVWEPFTRTLGKKSVTWSFYKNANWERHQFDFDLRGNERFDIFLANFNMTKYIHFTKSIPRSCFRQETKNERGLDMCRKQKIRIFAKSILKSQSKLNFLNCQYMLQFFLLLRAGFKSANPYSIDEWLPKSNWAIVHIRLIFATVLLITRFFVSSHVFNNRCLCITVLRVYWIELRQTSF